MSKKPLRLSNLLISFFGITALSLSNDQIIQAQYISQSDERCFSVTGHCVSEEFYKFWQENGGVSVFGLPLGSLQEEFINGKKVQVQWFEYSRLELNPEKNEVLVGQLGIERQKMANPNWSEFPRGERKNNCKFFEKTGQNLCGEFLGYWKSHGLELDGVAGKNEKESLALFGAPISEEQTLVIEGKYYRVQWFEKARLQYPSGGSTNIIQGALGRELFPLMPPTYIASTPELPTQTNNQINQDTPTSSTFQLPNNSGITSGTTSRTSSRTGSVTSSNYTSFISPPTSKPNIVINTLPNEKPENEKMAALKIVNNTGDTLRFILDGPTGDTWSLANGQTLQPDIKPGTYQSTTLAKCGSEAESFTIRQEKVKEFSFNCSPRVEFENTNEWLSRFILSGPTSINEPIRPGQKIEELIEPGDYQITVNTKCGNYTHNVTINNGDAIPVVTPECGAAKIKVINQSDINIRVKLLSGPTRGDWITKNGQSLEQEVLSGDYQLQIITACGSEIKNISIVKDEELELTAICNISKLSYSQANSGESTANQSITHIKITNNTEDSIRINLSGPTSKSWTVGNNQNSQQAVLPGNYQITVSTKCGSETDNFTLSPGETEDLIYKCIPVAKPPVPQTTTTTNSTPANTASISIMNTTGDTIRVRLSGPTRKNISIGNRRSQEIRLAPGNYRMSVSARCGSESESFSLDGGDSQSFSYECISF